MARWQAYTDKHIFVLSDEGPRGHLSCSPCRLEYKAGTAWLAPAKRSCLHAYSSAHYSRYCSSYCHARRFFNLEVDFLGRCTGRIARDPRARTRSYVRRLLDGGHQAPALLCMQEKLLLCTYRFAHPDSTRSVMRAYSEKCQQSDWKAHKFNCSPLFSSESTEIPRNVLGSATLNVSSALQTWKQAANLDSAAKASSTDPDVIAANNALGRASRHAFLRSWLTGAQSVSRKSCPASLSCVRHRTPSATRSALPSSPSHASSCCTPLRACRTPSGQRLQRASQRYTCHRTWRQSTDGRSSRAQRTSARASIRPSRRCSRWS